MYKRAIVRQPPGTFNLAIGSENDAPVDYLIVIEQHMAYKEALIKCGLEVIEMSSDEDYPDSCFIEDTAIVTPAFAIICSPGAESRKGEQVSVEKELLNFFPAVDRIEPPGTMDGGDVLQIENHFIVGISHRTNPEGARQFGYLVEMHGFTSSTIAVEHGLHLKSEVSYLSNDTILVSKNFSAKPEFRSFTVLEVDDDEIYAANSLWINGHILVPADFLKTRRLLKSQGFKIMEIPMSEFYKKDGGLSCLSLRI